jgi:CTP:molybdopterin cytidylyltransferase MocA
MTENFARGLDAFKESRSEQVLVTTCDIPLVNAATFEQFVARAQEKKLELAYPVVRRAQSEASFPGGQRTYARLRDGEFTGGNAVLVPLRIANNVHELLNTAYNARKNPLGLAKMLGPGLMLKFVSKRLSIRDVEERASRVLDCRAGAVEMSDAAIAFDVDKPSDWTTARDFLERTQ